MLNKIRTPLIAIFTLILFFTSISTSLAASSITEILPGKTIFDYGKEFCDKRSGDLMNLETWYSGKCSPETDSLSGDGVGFVDIIYLQFIEGIIGPQYGSFTDKIIELFTKVLSYNEQIKSGKNIAEITFSNQNSGLLGQLTNISSILLRTKPASSTNYTTYIAHNLQKNKITKNAYAADAGYGFTGLSPLLNVWKVFRNISYYIFSLAFIVYGVMIMFRIKIDAKTAVSIELAIPKIITTLLLITFSYAIVGLLIDFSTIFTYLSVNLLELGGLIDTSSTALKLASGLEFGALGSWLVNMTTGSLIAPFVLINLFIGTIEGPISILIGFIGGFLGVILFVIILLATIYVYIKLIMKLFGAYVSIIINLIFSPIILLGNLLPGNNSFSKWLMNIFGQLVVFPATIFLLTLSYALMAQPLVPIAKMLNLNPSFLGVNDMGGQNTNLWAPPMTIPTNEDISTAWPAENNSSLILGLVGLGILFMASKYVDMIQEALKIPPFKYGSAIGESLGWSNKIRGRKAPWLGQEDPDDKKKRLAENAAERRKAIQSLFGAN